MLPERGSRVLLRSRFHFRHFLFSWRFKNTHKLCTSSRRLYKRRLEGPADKNYSISVTTGHVGNYEVRWGKVGYRIASNIKICKWWIRLYWLLKHSKWHLVLQGERGAQRAIYRNIWTDKVIWRGRLAPEKYKKKVQKSNINSVLLLICKCSSEKLARFADCLLISSQRTVYTRNCYF